MTTLKDLVGHFFSNEQLHPIANYLPYRVIFIARTCKTGTCAPVNHCVTLNANCSVQVKGAIFNISTMTGLHHNKLKLYEALVPGAGLGF